MKLSAWAKKQGVSYRTAWRWYKEGKLPVPAEKTPSGTILVRADEHKNSTGGKNVIYARVSGSDQKKDLDRQVKRLVEFANSQGYAVNETVEEVGSGLNGHRKKLIRLLSDPNIETIFVEHRDRLARFGFEYIEAALLAQNRKVIVMEDEELKDDLVQDMVEVLTSFCARLYGKRSAKNKAKKAVEAIENDNK